MMKSPGLKVASTWRSLRRHYTGHWAALTVLGVLSIVGAILEAACLATLVPLVAAIASPTHEYRLDLGGYLGERSVGASMLFGLCTAAVAGRALVQFVVAFLDARTSGRYSALTRNRLLGDFLNASWSRQSEERSGALQLLLTENIAHGLACLRSVVQLLVSGCNFLVLLATALFVDVAAAAMLLAAAAVLFLIMRPLSNFAQRNSKEKTALNATFASTVSQTVGLAREIRIYGATQALRRQLDATVEQIRRSRGSATFAAASVPIVYQATAAAIVLAGLAWVYRSDSAQFTGLAASAILLVRAFSYAQLIQVANHHVVEAMPFLQELDDAGDEYRASRERWGTTALTNPSRFVFDDVGFEYRPGRSALAGVDFCVEQGEAIGLVGPSGSGKSTLVQILMRLRMPTQGNYLVDDRSAAEYAPNDWTRAFGFVPQEPHLISGTVADNIRFFREDVSAAAVEDAARKAGIHDEIIALPAGYDTPVGDLGNRLSGGQRQRICIARALAGDPQVIVFDEPTSSLDVHSEARIQESLAQIKGRVTLFIIAHRLSTLSICDKVMVLRDGKLQSFGPPEELAATDDYYGEALRLSQVR